MSIKIAIWNVNSIKARREHVKRWLEANQPDLLMIEELKGLDFPTAEFEAIGYQSNAVTQKAYNGVAIFSKQPQNVVLDHLPGDETDEQARYLEIEYPSALPAGSRQTQSVRVINIYLPNGNPVFPPSSSQRQSESSTEKETDSDLCRNDAFGEKYRYKLSWMDRLYTRLKELRAQNIPFVIGGDFNVIPEDKDCHNPQAWKGDALFRPETHLKWQSLLNLGLYDAFRILNKNAGEYSFWDYQAGAWQKDNGIRIDHFLLSPPLVDKLINCTIDKAPRGEEKASDHTPVILELDI